jgi:hypothetical protein
MRNGWRFYLGTAIPHLWKAGRDLKLALCRFDSKHFWRAVHDNKEGHPMIDKDLHMLAQHKIIVVFLLVFLWVNHASAGDVGQTRLIARQPGEWLQIRGDRALSGRCLIKGRIVSPAISWKRYIGAHESLLEVDFLRRDERPVKLPASDQVIANLDDSYRRWRISPPQLDYDRSQIPAGMGGRVGKFLSNLAGLQQIQFENDQISKGRAKLMARDNGRWVEVWKSEQIDDVMQGLNTITGDFDGDGRQEVAFAPWHHLWVLDLETGKTKSKGLFYQPDALGDGRGYGWLGAFDLDGDGKKEFVIISDTQVYISVLGWKEGSLKLLWGRKYKSKSEAAVSDRGVLLRPGTNPIRDVDGDGLPEIVVSSYDERRANASHWQTEVIDGLRGVTKEVLNGEILEGLRDIDGDGVAEMFCSNRSGARMRLSVFGYGNGTIDTRWQLDDAFFQKHNLPYFSKNIASGAAGGHVTLLAGAVEVKTPPCFITRKIIDRQSSLVKLTAWRADETGNIRELGSVTGPHATGLAIANGTAGVRGLLVRTQSPGETKLRGSAQLRALDKPEAPRDDRRRATSLVSTTKGVARYIYSRRISAPLSPVVVGHLQPNSVPTIVVQQACEHMLAFRAPDDGREANVIWQTAGRGIHEGSAHRTGGTQFGGVILADVKGDGTLATIVATRGPKNQAQLVMLGPCGNELWHREFDDLPGNPPGFTLPGLSFWFAGRFTNSDREDILVTTKSGVLTRLTLLDGRTGKPSWSKIAGGMLVSVYDHDGDGLDDALTTCWSEIHVLKGTTGRTLMKLNTAMNYFGGGKVWPADAYSCVFDFMKKGRPQILYWPAYAARGLVDLDQRLIWEEIYLPPQPPDANPWASHIGQNSIHPAIGDFDGDGRIEIISSADRTQQGGSNFVCRCYDAITGHREWELPLDVLGSSRSAMSADIDSDGRDEAIFTRGNTLYAVGTTDDGRSGKLRWKLAFPTTLGPPTIADANGNGRAQILVVCADGFIYCVDNAE